MFKLFVLRHGHAEAEAPADNLRTLSPRGELEVHKVCQAKCDELAQVQLVLHSPYVRTVQTAAILRQYSAAPQQASDLLVPDADPRILVDALYQLSQQYQSIALVSHQPLVGTLIDDLGGFECGRYRMGTAALASLSCDPMAALCCTLDWLIHP